MKALATTDRDDFERLEDTIERGLQTFIEVGAALAEIRDRRLYRETHGTFEAYCRERWGMTRTYAHRLAAASEAVGNLLPMGNIPFSEFSPYPKGEVVSGQTRRKIMAEAGMPLPDSERVARPLTKLKEPEQQRQAWEKAVETTGGKPTARDVEAAVSEIERPDEGSMEARVRRGMEMGGRIDDQAAAVGISRFVYGRARHLVLLSDDERIRGDDREAVSDAIRYMNRHDSVNHPWSSVQDVMRRVWGDGWQGAGADASDKKREQAFMRAYGALSHAMKSADAIDLPLMTPERAELVAADLRAGISKVRNLMNQVREMME